MIMDGLPGVIASDDDFGVNSDGIHGDRDDDHPVRGLGPRPASPNWSAPQTLQYSKSIDDFVRIMLDGNNGGYANDWLVGDNKTGEIALLELELKNHAVKRTKDGCYLVEISRIRWSPGKKPSSIPPKKDSSPNAREGMAGLDRRTKRTRSTLSWQSRLRTDDSTPFARTTGANERTLCGRVEISPSRRHPNGTGRPYYPGGTVQSKVTDATLAEKLAFWGQVGHAGSDFLVQPLLKEREEYSWMPGLLRDMKNADHRPNPELTQNNRTGYGRRVRETEVFLCRATRSFRTP